MKPEVRIKRVLSVWDGDTFRVDIMGWPPVVGENISVRIANIDTPEIRGAKCAHEKSLSKIARQFTTDKLAAGHKITLHNIERGKYFRLIAEVRIDGVDLAQMLIDQGLAKPYTGGTRPSWCE